MIECASLLGFECIEVRSSSGGEAIEIGTPFTFADGAAITVFAIPEGTATLLTDEGLTIHRLHSMGLSKTYDSRAWRAVRSLVERHGASLSEEGEVLLLTTAAHRPTAFARFLSALLAVRDWGEREAGAIESDDLLEQVAVLLHAWRPAAEIKREVSLRGISRREHKFDFLVDRSLVDAIRPHGGATGAELRKISDVSRAGDRPTDLEFRVVVDDRRDPKAAAEELAILSGSAKAWPMTRLARAAGVVTAR